MQRISLILAAATLAVSGAPAYAAEAPNDAQIAHIAYTAGSLDIAAARQALEKSRNPAVRGFADTMIRDHQAVNDKALELVKALGVTPQDNPTSQSLTEAAKATMKRLDELNGPDFDRAYVRNEVTFHKTVNDALNSTLIPSANNGQLKSLLTTGLMLFREHQMHADHLARRLK